MSCWWMRVSFVCAKSLMMTWTEAKSFSHFDGFSTHSQSNERWEKCVTEFRCSFSCMMHFFSTFLEFDLFQSLKCGATTTFTAYQKRFCLLHILLVLIEFANFGCGVDLPRHNVFFTWFIWAKNWLSPILNHRLQKWSQVPKRKKKSKSCAT